MRPGTVEWLQALLSARGGSAAIAEIQAALMNAEPETGAPEQATQGEGPAEAREASVRDRLRHSPLFVTLPDERVALTRLYLQGANFRYSPASWELAQGLLSLEATELALVCAQSGGGPDPELSWRGLHDEAPNRTRLARAERGWVLPGLSAWFAAVGFEAGDDLLVHVREIEGPLLVFERVSRFARDEGPIARRNALLLEAAIGVLREEGGGWLGVDRLLKQLVARYDFRRLVPPDSFGQRLLVGETRFTLSRDGGAVRLSYFYHDDTARAFLATCASPQEALPAFFEEFPPDGAGDREKALRYLEALWEETPRPELGGLTPTEARAQEAKIVPFGRPGQSG
jgi:hypothetical protein